MSKTLTIDERHFQTAANRAREVGKTPETYIESLIDAATMTSDELLAPVRDAFAKSGITEDELDETVSEARRQIFKRSQRKPRR